MSRKVKFKDEAGVEHEIILRADIARLVDQDTRLTDDDGVFFQRQLEAIEAQTGDVGTPAITSLDIVSASLLRRSSLWSADSGNAQFQVYLNSGIPA